MGYPKEWLKRCEGAKVPDLIGQDCRLLFVGINPGLSTALIGVHFGHPSNRFWPALRRAGLIDWQPNLQPYAPSVPIDCPGSGEYGDQQRPGLWTAATQPHFRHPSNRFYPALRAAGVIDFEIDQTSGMSVDQRSSLIDAGMGITNLVNRATARASELDKAELARGAERLSRLVDSLRPAVVAVAGITAYRDAFGDRKARLGRQPEDLGAAELWVVPNPSGLNAHETIDSLAEWFGAVAKEAGVP